MKRFLWLIPMAAVIVLDQLTKWLVVTNMNYVESPPHSIPVIDGVLNLTYIHNDGAAWGMFGGYTWLLISITIVVMLAGIALLLKWGLRDKLIFWAAALILSGGLGNMIDRIFNDGLVVDFLEFAFIDFPVFNIADCAIVIGAGLIMLSLVKSIIDEQKQKSKAVVIPVPQEKNDDENV